MKYKIIITNGLFESYKTVEGKAVKLKGFEWMEFFSHESVTSKSLKYSVSEKSTGRRIGMGNTVAEAKKDALYRLNKKTRPQLERRMEQHKLQCR